MVGVEEENRKKAELREAVTNLKNKTPEWETRFIYTATHELKTPLTSIKGYMELIQEHLDMSQGGPELNELKYMVGVVARNTERLESLLNDILEIQRLIEGRLEVSMVEHNVAEFLQQVAEDLTPILNKRSQCLQVESSVESLVFGRQRLAQVLQNLIHNSSKFSPDGSTIQLRVEKVNDDVMFSVTDEGVGLSPKDISKLFKPFPKIKKPGSYAGTGLGLSICNGIVELHGGEIWAESPGTGRGSTFFFTIPDDISSE